MLKAWVVLFKLRVVVLLLFAAAGGLVLGAENRPDGGAWALLLLTGTMSAGGAGALNEYIERETDAQMQRTRRRPLAAGRYTWPGLTALAGVGLIAGAVLLAWPRPAMAFFLALGALIYVVVYTIWLKPRTPLNVVLGGTAGSCAVLAGGAAAGRWHTPDVLLLALLILVWNPAHFWSLALAYRADYIRAGVPMLPAVLPPRRAARWILAHAAVAALTALALALRLGWPAPVWVGAASLWLLWEMARLAQHPGRALRAFKASNIYLALVLAVVCLSAMH